MGLTVLDASVIIAVLDADDPHHETASVALRARLDARDTLVVPVSAYAEALVGPFRRGPAAVHALDAFLEALPAGIQPATRAAAHQAARLRAEHGSRLRLPDAFVIAAALELSADLVLTADRGWPELPVAVQLI